MIAARTLMRSNGALQQARQMSVISTPPKVRISFAEKLVHGGAIFLGVLSIPAWVLVNIKNYKGPKA